MHALRKSVRHYLYHLSLYLTQLAAGSFPEGTQMLGSPGLHIRTDCGYTLDSFEYHVFYHVPTG